MRLFQSVIFVLLLLGARGLFAQGIVSGEPSLKYETIGSGETTFVVLHGGPGVTYDYMRPEWDRLAEWGRVIYYNQQRCSGEQVTSWEDFVEDLDRLRSKLAPGQKIVLAGSSWGTQLALLYTLHHPGHVEALLLSGVVFWTFPRPPRSELGQVREKNACVDSILSTIDTSSVAGQQRRRQVRRNLGSGVDSLFRKRLRRAHCAEVEVQRKDWPERDALSTITVPVLILRGGSCYMMQDGSYRMAEVLPEVEIETIEEGGHDPWYSSPDKFFREVGEFLKTKVK